jgi:hypothetical protein
MHNAFPKPLPVVDATGGYAAVLMDLYLREGVAGLAQASKLDRPAGVGYPAPVMVPTHTRFCTTASKLSQ